MILKPHFIFQGKFSSLGFIVLCFVFQFFLTTNSMASDSLSYSGRLVNANGSPVAGPVDLKVELSYTNAPATILCSQDFANIVLSNGVFHLKLDLNCGANGALGDVLNLVPANESAAIRVTDVTHAKTYSFQAMHSMPFANISGTAKQLVQMGATNNQVLKWNDTSKKWEPGTPGGGGTVTSVSGTLPISVATGTSTPMVSMTQANSTTAGYLSSADWNTFNSKQGPIAAGTAAQYYRGDKSWQTLDTSAVPENVANLYFTNARALGVPLTGFSSAAGSIVATDTALQAFGKAQGQIDAINTASSNYLIKNSTDSITGVVNVGTIGLLQLAYTPIGLNDATNKSYVDSQDSLKVNKAGDTMSGALTLDSDLKIKGGANYVTLKGHASSSAYNLILPSSAGTAGYVLSTDGSGNTSWINPSAVSAGTGTVTSASIVDGTIVDVDISATAAITQSKIANLTTDLAAKQSTTLANGNILVGSAGNVATAVAVSGDATLSNTGALTLANSGVVANTYNSVTVDAKGRVTGGTNPTTLAGYGITDILVTGVSVTAPITNTGSASVPLIGMPAATTAVDGYLSATNWNTFNNKQSAITAASTLNTGSVTTNLQGGVVVGPYGAAAGNTGEIHFNELSANGANYVALKAPDALAANIVYTLPVADGSSGQVLTTNAAGTLSWTTVATTGTSLVGDIGGTIGANTIGSGKVTLTHLSATGTKDNTTYLRGDNTWAAFANDVRSTVLTGLSLTTTGVIAATDSAIAAFGKLQKQISDLSTSVVGGDLSGNLPNPTIAKLQGAPLTITSPATKNILKYNGTNWVNSMIAASDLSATGTADATTYLAGDNTWKNFNTNVIAAPLTGLSATGMTKATSSLLASDSITAAFNKLLFTQGDYVSKSVDQTINGTLAINSLTGFITVPTPVGVNDAANKGYVDSFGQWTKGSGANAADIYRASGNVGIGTTSPGAKLDVNGTMQSTVSGGLIQLYNDSATVSRINTNTGSELDLGVGGAKYLTVMPSGNVGIGTTSPITQLNALTSSSFLNTNPTNFAANPWGISTSTYHNSSYGAWFSAWKSRGTEAAKAAVNNGDPIGGLLSVGHDGTNFQYNGAAYFVVGGTVATGSVPADFVVQTGSSYSTQTEKLRVTSVGNVGIGTTTPKGPLHIHSNSTIYETGSLLLENSTNSSVYALINSNNNLYIGYNSNAAGGYPQAGYSSPMYIQAGGNVGIGTTAPAEKLDVSGKVKATTFESTQTAVVKLYLNVCGGACASYHTLSTWFNIGANYAHSIANNDTGTFTTNGTGSVTINKAGTYLVRITSMHIPTADEAYFYGCPFINGSVSCQAAASEFVPHAFSPAGSWKSTSHNFTLTLSAGTVLSYGYYPTQALNYWAYDGYTGMEVVRVN